MTDIYILGGSQTDFARNWTREDKAIYDLFADTVNDGLEQSKIDPEDIDVAHVGNFVSALFTGQAQLNGFLVMSIRRCTIFQPLVTKRPALQVPWRSLPPCVTSRLATTISLVFWVSS